MGKLLSLRGAPRSGADTQSGFGSGLIHEGTSRTNSSPRLQETSLPKPAAGIMHHAVVSSGRTGVNGATERTLTNQGEVACEAEAAATVDSAKLPNVGVLRMPLFAFTIWDVQGT